MAPSRSQARGQGCDRGNPQRRGSATRGSAAALLRLDPAEIRWFRRRLLRWYRKYARPWPWRASANSYHVWVAEVMLQQTRVEVVAKAFPRFLARFPSVADLALAPLENVLAVWSGLGYYTRARNLHRAAQWLWKHGYREFPREPSLARALPGVGPYTVAAVLSIAYNQRLAAVDANVRRVLGRVTGNPSATKNGKLAQAIAVALLDPHAPGDWNQALMELGQRLCIPRTPQCPACPWQPRCATARSSVALRIAAPRRRGPGKSPIELVADLVFDTRGRIVVERGVFPYLRHLWVPVLHEAQASAAGLAPSRGQSLGTFRHAIGKRQFRVSVYLRKLSNQKATRFLHDVPAPGERRLVTPKELEHLGRSSLLLKSWQLWVRQLARGGVAFSEANQ
ncbi:Adenine DNA glycosylase [bacterium HR30]|nr:Adenine DNA glycosylase [bacterium HR30]